METYVDLFISSDGENITSIHKKMLGMGLKPTLGDHDFVYNWNGIVNIEEEIEFIQKIQLALRGTGAMLRFTTKR